MTSSKTKDKVWDFAKIKIEGFIEMGYARKDEDHYIVGKRISNFVVLIKKSGTHFVFNYDSDGPPRAYVVESKTANQSKSVML